MSGDRLLAAGWTLLALGRALCADRGNFWLAAAGSVRAAEESPVRN
eukprot:COSAG06_NODE_41877_length_387_cov_0.538194_1_plen_45_part_10